MTNTPKPAPRWVEPLLLWAPHLIPAALGVAAAVILGSPWPLLLTIIASAHAAVIAAGDSNERREIAEHNARRRAETTDAEHAEDTDQAAEQRAATVIQGELADPREVIA